MNSILFFKISQDSTSLIGMIEFDDMNNSQYLHEIYLFNECTACRIAIHPDNTTVATGQVGKTPYVCVWDTNTLQTLSILKDGFKEGVAAVAFDKSGNVCTVFAHVGTRFSD